MKQLFNPPNDGNNGIINTLLALFAIGYILYVIMFSKNVDRFDDDD